MEETAEPGGAAEPAPAEGAVGAEAAGARGRAAADVTAFALGALPVAVLAAQDGGYDPIVRGDVGVLAWFAVLAGAATGVLPRRAVSRRTLLAAGLLAGYGAWAAIGIPGSESAGRAVAEVGRIATLAGVFVLAAGLRTERGARPALAGMAAAIVGVALVSLAYRLHPAWFPASSELILPGARSRLSYPLGYWNGLAALTAFGVPLLLSFAAAARSAAIRALAAAGLPVLVLVCGLTLSRGGFALLAVAAAAYVALGPRRVAGLLLAVTGGALGALLIAAAYARDDLVDGARTALAASQGDGLVPLVALAATAAAAAGLGIARLEPRLDALAARPSRRALLGGGAALALAAIGLGLVLNVPGTIADRWSQFRTPDIPLSQKARPDRLASGSGTGRYQFWEAAIRAGNTEPLTGIGAGAYELWWARTAPVYLYARDAHSLYLESYAELGLVGALLILAFVAVALWGGARQALRGPPGWRETGAAATAAVATFAVAAAIDWAWELTILPAAALGLAAIALGGPGDDPPPCGRAWRLGPAALAAVALVAVGLPLLEATALRQSRDRAASGDLAGALAAARTAASLEPDAAEPRLQRALLLERTGELAAAAAAAAAATAAEPTNWRIWAVRSRIAAERGQPAAALQYFRVARGLAGRTPAIAARP